MTNGGWPRLLGFVRSKAIGATKEQEVVGYAFGLSFSSFLYVFSVLVS